MKILFILLISTLASFANEYAWKQDLSKMDEDKVELAPGQTRSIINWKKLDPQKWLDFDVWKEQRAFKDKNPKWKLHYRDVARDEKIGFVIKCVGICNLYAGKKPSPLSFSSVIYEGDEIKTGKDSYLWVVLASGAIMRFSPDTLVAFNEINFSKKLSFINLRLNQGHVYYQNRVKGKFTVLNLPETDVIFSPLKVLKANREFYGINRYRRLKKFQLPLYESLLNPGYKSHYLALNSFLNKENSYLDALEHKVFINTPNATLKLTSLNFDLFYEPNYETLVRVTDKTFNFTAQKSFLKKDFFLAGRGEIFSDLELNQVYKITRKGDFISEFENNTFKFSQIGTKRIPSIHIAREILLREKFEFLFKEKVSAKSLITDYGYRLWKEAEINQRESFLVDKIAERESENLARLHLVLKNRKYKGLTKDYYRKAYQEQLSYDKKLKSLESVKRLKFSDLEYFTWVMNNGKF